MQFIPLVILIIAACVADHQVQCDQASWDEAKEKLDQVSTEVSTLLYIIHNGITTDRYVYLDALTSQNSEAEDEANSQMKPTLKQLDDYIVEAGDLQVDIEECLGDQEVELRNLANSTIVTMVACRSNLVLAMDDTFGSWLNEVLDANNEVALIYPLLDECSIDDNKCIADVTLLINNASTSLPKYMTDRMFMADYIISHYLTSQVKTCSDLPVEGMVSRSSDLFGKISGCIENKLDGGIPK